MTGLGKLNAQSEKTVKFRRTPLSQGCSFGCLNNNDVINGNVSDHYPVIHDDVLFWNIMMQGKKRAGTNSFNNGFGIVENEVQYIIRLIKVAHVIAEACYRDPTIHIICLCEGPIETHHISIFYTMLISFQHMKKFVNKDKFYKPNQSEINWGLLLLTAKHLKVSRTKCSLLESFPKLANRIQMWQLTYLNEEKYLVLGHLPFAGDENKSDRDSLSTQGKEYCRLINVLLDEYRDKHLIICADFNFNPYLIKDYNDRRLDQINQNNSILLSIAESGKYIRKPTTVDGILLSEREKQKYHFLNVRENFFYKAKLEYRFFQKSLNKFKELLSQDQNCIATCHDFQFEL